MNAPLPETYLRWLEEVADTSAVKRFGRSWWISSRTELEETVDIDHSSTPAWQQLQSYVKMYRSLSGEEDGCLLDQNAHAFPFKRLEQCVVIGECNGDPLCVDPSDGYSVWCLYHDGADVEQLAQALNRFTVEGLHNLTNAQPGAAPNTAPPHR